MMVARCTTKHIPVSVPKVELAEDISEQIQDSIRNLVHTGKCFTFTFSNHLRSTFSVVRDLFEFKNLAGF